MSQAMWSRKQLSTSPLRIESSYYISPRQTGYNLGEKKKSYTKSRLLLATKAQNHLINTTDAHWQRFIQPKGLFPNQTKIHVKCGTEYTKRNVLNVGVTQHD